MLLPGRPEDIKEEGGGASCWSCPPCRGPVVGPVGSLGGPKSPGADNEEEEEAEEAAEGVIVVVVVAPDKKAARAAADGVLALPTSSAPAPPLPAPAPAPVPPCDVVADSAEPPPPALPSTPPSMALSRAATPLASRAFDAGPAAEAGGAADTGGLISSCARRSQRLPSPSLERLDASLPSIVVCASEGVSTVPSS